MYLKANKQCSSQVSYTHDYSAANHPSGWKSIELDQHSANNKFTFDMPWNNVCSGSDWDCGLCGMAFTLGLSSSTSSNVIDARVPKSDVWIEDNGKVSFKIDTTPDHSFYKVVIT